MTKVEMIKLLEGLPDETEIYVRRGDDAYPIAFRYFGIDPGDKRRVVYIQHDRTKLDYHRNFPEGYMGVVEQSLPLKKKIRKAAKR